MAIGAGRITGASRNEQNAGVEGHLGVLLGLHKTNPITSDRLLKIQSRKVLAPLTKMTSVRRVFGLPFDAISDDKNKRVKS